MSQSSNDNTPANPGRKKVVQGEKLRGADKVARIPIKVVPTEDLPRKPDWIRVRVPAGGEVQRIKSLLRKQKLIPSAKKHPAPICRSALVGAQLPL